MSRQIMVMVLHSITSETDKFVITRTVRETFTFNIAQGGCHPHPPRKHAHALKVFTGKRAFD